MRKLACGNCGWTEFNVFKKRLDEVIIHCINCDSSTVIQPSAPRLQMNWGELSQGILCEIIGDSEKEKNEDSK